MRSGWWSALVAGLALLATTGACAAQEIALLVAVHIGIAYQRGFHASADVADDTAALLAHLPESFFNGFPIRAVPIELDDTPDLAAAVLQGHVMHSISRR